MGLAKELRVGYDCCEGVAQIVGNGVRHSANRRQTFRLEQILLRAGKALSHSVECERELGDFVAAASVQPVGEVASLEGRDSGEQTGKRAGKSVRDQENQ